MVEINGRNQIHEEMDIYEDARDVAQVAMRAPFRHQA
jgi:hypothetical protein